MWWKFLNDGSRRCIPVLVYGWLEKIWGEKPTTKKCILQQTEHEEYKWSGLWTCTASLKCHGEKDPRLLSRCLLKNRCFAVGGCIWYLSKYMLRALKVRSDTFLHSTWISMAGLIKDSRWVLWAWKKAQGLWIMPRRVQARAAYRYRHAGDGWKRYSGRDHPGT